MDFVERIIYFAVGGGVGFILGYIVARLHTIEEEVHEVLDLEKAQLPPKRDERGTFRMPKANTLGLFVVIMMTAWATFQTAHVNAELDQTLSCITSHNTTQGEALGGRDAAIKAGTQSEIDLWTLYEKLYKIAKSDPKKIPVVQNRLNDAIIEYRDILIRLQKTREIFPYPNPDVLKNCDEETQDE